MTKENVLRGSRWAKGHPPHSLMPSGFPARSALWLSRTGHPRSPTSTENLVGKALGQHFAQSGQPELCVLCHWPHRQGWAIPGEAWGSCRSQALLHLPLEAEAPCCSPRSHSPLPSTHTCCFLSRNNGSNRSQGPPQARKWLTESSRTLEIAQGSVNAEEVWLLCSNSGQGSAFCHLKLEVTLNYQCTCLQLQGWYGSHSGEKVKQTKGTWKRSVLVVIRHSRWPQSLGSNRVFPIYLLISGFDTRPSAGEPSECVALPSSSPLLASLATTEKSHHTE